MDHLNRCKTSIWYFGALLFVLKVHDFLFSISRRGTWHTIRDHVQRSYLIVWDTEPDQLCVPAPSFHCLWQPAKPSTGMSLFPTVFKTTVRFSQSDLLLTSSDGTVASSKDVERILLHCFSRLVIHYFLSGLTEVFLHVRCIPHQ